MPDTPIISTLTLLDGITYNLADAEARREIEHIIPGGSLGDLAYKDSASASYTPSGTVSGSVSAFSASVSGECLVLSTSTVAITPTFSGTASTITVS